MAGRSQILRKASTLVILMTIVLSACKSETVEVTRIKIMERRVIERVVVTVEVTRIHRVVETPSITLDALVPPGAGSNSGPSPTPPPATATPPAPRQAPVATATPTSAAKETGERLLAALKDMEQTLLTLVQTLNSDPLPGTDIIGLFDALRAAPNLTVPEGEAELQAINARYREQLDLVLGQATDLYDHLAKIESGEADQTKVDPIQLGLARDAVSTSTSTLQGLIRELETYLASQP